MANGDVPDGSMAPGEGSGGDGEEAAWLDLVARYGAPGPATGDDVPWPEREDLAGPVRVSPGDAPPDAASLSDVPPFTEAVLSDTGLPDTGFPDTGLPDTGPLPDTPPLPDTLLPDTLLPGTGLPGTGLPGTGLPGTGPLPDTLSFPAGPARPAGGFGPGRGPRDAPIPENPADEHFSPPPAPPLPRLAPVTKGAWLALFGGPLYLIIATVAGWTVSGLAAFIAVAAFVGGFVVIVLRMDNGRPPDSGSDDDGAVV